MNAAVLRMQGNMSDSIGATNLASGKESLSFLAKGSGVAAEDSGVFSGSLARIGGLKAWAAEIDKDKEFQLCAGRLLHSS